MTREEAKELLTHVLMTYEPRDQYGDLDDSEPYEEAITMAIEALSTDAVPTDRAGEWHKEIEGNGWNEWAKVTCSECGRRYTDLYPRNFCPNCGADMRGKGR